MNLKEESKNVQKKFEELTNKVQFSDYIMPFGRYKGEFLIDVLLEDRQYFDWLLERADGELKEAMEWQLKENG